jgi:ABC-type multidrug transport system fused ATPase/permease subunit
VCLVIEYFVVDRLTNDSLDYKTDAVIQRTLRTEIGRDVTVITIAHRLQTIMDADKIVSACLLCL